MPPVTFPGPYREEMSVEAIVRMMTPPTELTEEMLEEEPWAAWAFGTPTTIVPDNDRTLIDRKSDVKGKSVSVRVDLGGSRIINKKNTHTSMTENRIQRE